MRRKTADSTKSLPPVLYAIWQKPFIAQKLAPLFSNENFYGSSSLLELGCGHGANAQTFKKERYCGIDIDPLMIEKARGGSPGEFHVGNIVKDDLPVGRFQAVLLHSVLHHLNDESVLEAGAKLHRYLTADGSIHIIDAIRPEKPGFRKFLAWADRGHYFRKREHWNQLLNHFLSIKSYSEFSLKLGGITFYDMFYVQGSPKAING